MTRTARHLPAALLPALAALALAACGSSDDATTASTAAASTAPAVTTPAKARYTPAQVARIAGFEKRPDGTWTNPTGCTITMILLTNADVLKERTSQDSLVVTNGTDDVGVKFDAKAGCREALLANLSQVK